MNQLFKSKKFWGLLALAVTGLFASQGVSAQIPYVKFDLSKSLVVNGFTTIDANGDGTSWVLDSASNFTNEAGEKVTKNKYSVGAAYGITADDWLVTPSIYFEAGRTYKAYISVAKYSFREMPNVFELKMGSGNTVNGLSTSLISLEEGTLPEKPGNCLWEFPFEITVDADGDYFIGLRGLVECTSSVGNSTEKISLTDFVIYEGIKLVTPAAIDDFTLTPDPAGGKTITIDFTAPSKAKNGENLTALTKIDLLRDGDKIYTFENPTPGEKLSYKERLALNGQYTYSVQAFTQDGGGDIVSATTFVGINVPASVSNVEVSNTSNTAAHITWDAPALDKDKYPINPANVSYDVYRATLFGTPVLIAEEVEDLFYDDDIAKGGAVTSQDFYTYSVVARTTSGKAEEVESARIPLGLPYELPYLESFPNTNQTYLFTSVSLVSTTRWDKIRYLDEEDIRPYDNDNGMLFLNGYAGGGVGYFSSGLINLGDLEAPGISFFTYNITGCDPADHTVQLEVIATDGTSKKFDAFVPGYGWNKNLFSLAEFKGKTIRYNIYGTRYNTTNMALDCIEVANIYGHDLVARSISVPSKVHTDEPFEISVEVYNNGAETSGDYSVELYCDGSLVDTNELTSLPAGNTEVVSFTRTHDINDAETVKYSAKVVYDADLNLENNETEEVSTSIRKNSYPTVQDLSGEVASGVVKLTWSEPDTSKAQPFETTDDFESYTSWATENVGDWVFVDLDKGQISGFLGEDDTVEMPGVPSYSQQSWWVFDNTAENFNNGSFRTTSGSKFLMAMLTGIVGEGPIKNDDWAISPELYGGPQTISFFARSYDTDPTDLESFEVLYSTGSVDPADFVSLGVKEDIPSDFTEFEFDLPDGAKRFAIRYISDGKFAILVDDVTFVPVGNPASFSINGYNVYRDGVKINNSPVEETEFEDADAPEGFHNYNVTVLYSAGESQFSNLWSSDPAGVENIAVENAPVEYFNLQGIRVAAPEAGKPYIVRRGTEVRKVIFF